MSYFNEKNPSRFNIEGGKPFILDLLLSKSFQAEKIVCIKYIQKKMKILRVNENPG